MAIELNPYIQQLSWAEARELILPVNPDFVRHADELDLPEECCIFKVRYRYGDYLLKDGKFMLRNSLGENISIEHPDIPEIIKKKLSYAPTVPMGINLDKHIETFFTDSSSRIIPISILPKGNIFALAGVMTQNDYAISKSQFWNITAGARSVYSTPKISIAYKHKRVAREFGTNLTPPKTLEQHWGTFKELLQSPNLEETWHMDTLFFSQEFPTKNDTLNWSKFNNYLRSYIWDRMKFWRNHYMFGYIIAQAAAEANIRANPAIINSIKQLAGIAIGFIPGLSFKPDEDAFPNARISSIYREIYQLEYPPLFMQTRHFNPTDQIEVFYSLSLPGVLEFFPDFNPFKSKFDELRELAHATKKIQSTLSKKDFGIREIENSIFKGLVNSTINFYHSASEEEALGIKAATQIAELHERSQSDNVHSSSIFRGLVGIAQQPKG